MKWLFITAISITLPVWVHAKTAKALEPDPSAPQQVIISGSAIDPAGHPVVLLNGGPGATAHAFALVGDPNDGRSTHARTVVRVEPGADAANRPWLGISISEVPDALRTHLALEGGVMVGNVVKNSPADVAGLRQYDIVTAINGKPVAAESAGAVSLLHEHKPGENITLGIIRDGRDQTLRVTLGSLADSNMEWKFTQAPDTEVIDRIRTRGKMIRKDDKGNYVVEDLGDVTGASNLPGGVLQWIPESGQIAIKVTVENGERNVEATRERDGVKLTVSRAGEGPIVVTRTDQDGRDTIAEYTTPEELEAADAEGFELWQRVGSSTVITMQPDGTGFGGAYSFDFHLDADDLRAHAEAWKEKADEWREQFQSHMEDARKAYEEAMKQWSEQAGKDSSADGPDGHWRQLMPLFGDPDSHLGAHRFLLRQLGKPKHEFELSVDGSIEVRIRRGDSELVREFASEDDLAARDPQLYEKYVKLMEADSEKE
jgi:hypothetical protein